MQLQCHSSPQVKCNVKTLIGEKNQYWAGHLRPKKTVHMCFNHSFFPPTGLALPPAFPTMVDNHVSHNYLGAMEPKPVYQPPQVTPSRYSPVPRHILGEEDFTR